MGKTKKGQEDRDMTEARIDGRIYELRFDMYAMEIAEEEFGSMKELFDRLSTGRQQVKTLKGIFRAMANSARAFRGDEENVTGNEIMRLTVREMSELSAAIQKEIAKSMKKETADGGEADDEDHDLYETESDRKNG